MYPVSEQTVFSSFGDSVVCH